MDLKKRRAWEALRFFVLFGFQRLCLSRLIAVHLMGKHMGSNKILKKPNYNIKISKNEKQDSWQERQFFGRFEFEPKCYYF